MDHAKEMAKIFVQGVGYRQANLLSQNKINKTVQLQEPEFKEDGKRQELAKLAETTSLPASNISIQKSHATLQAFKSLKDHVFNNPNLDSETIVNFNQIESYLNSLITKYSTH